MSKLFGTVAGINFSTCEGLGMQVRIPIDEKLDVLVSGPELVTYNSTPFATWVPVDPPGRVILPNTGRGFLTTRDGEVNWRNEKGVFTVSGPWWVVYKDNFIVKAMLAAEGKGVRAHRSAQRSLPDCDVIMFCWRFG